MNKLGKYASRTIAYALLSTALALPAATVDAATYRWLTARGANVAVVKAVEDVAAKYKASHPDFNLTIESVSDRPSYLQKVKILATGGQLPDLFDADAEPYFADIVANGLVADVGKIDAGWFFERAYLHDATVTAARIIASNAEVRIDDEWANERGLA